MRQAGAAAFKVVCGDRSAVPDPNGNFEILDTVPEATASSSAKGRCDTAKYVVGRDTLRKIAITSSVMVLPTNYIVQRNISVSLDRSFSSKPTEAWHGVVGKVVEVLWWTADSIAHVVTLGQGTNAKSFSGYIYNVYDDSAYSANAHLYYLLARIKSGATSSDSVLVYTDVMDVKAKAGDLSYSADQFATDYTFFRLGYPRTPVDSSLAVFGARTTYIADTLLLGNSVVYYLGGKASELFEGYVQIDDPNNELVAKFTWTKIVMVAEYKKRTSADTIAYMTSLRKYGSTDTLAYMTYYRNPGPIVNDTISIVRTVGSSQFVHVFDIAKKPLCLVSLNRTELLKLDSTITIKSYLVK